MQKQSIFRYFRKIAVFLIAGTVLIIISLESLKTIQSDSGLTYERYEAFLHIISDTSRFVVVPLKQLNSTYAPGKVVIAIKHDVDADLERALYMATLEYAHHIRGSYYILHTSDYYLENADNKIVHNEAIVPVLQRIQSYGHEIGWHNDLVTLDVIYKQDAVEFLRSELTWLRSHGIHIVGTSAHGSIFSPKYGYNNYYFWNECKTRTTPDRPNNDFIIMNSDTVVMKHAAMKDFGLTYEAYFLDHNKDYNDIDHVMPDCMIHPDQMLSGQRIIILIHPQYWHYFEE
ncbi:MAG: hypothetical protein WCM76_06080 [Bacteroidota bacterium]